ncbi:hypothetical protein CsatB_022670 [Cannabis sativa]|uniref:Uncharacterized protein n=2 Tax=Cannabis sativa TaxID=3483 RepID=A0A7J6H5K7_CANSA|nr:uncharacterized protein LOC115712722 [Cannabis sativa]KAF4390557.1 hypothetical protein F8388_006054 [Cannabis sativa]KAF4404684.1 hypothetical protein G4B88_006070 [Cannabis sativa]
MDSEDPNLELVNVAIQKLKEEQRQIKEISEDDDDDQLLLSRLLSQLESLKGENNLEQDVVGLKKLGEKGDNNDIDEEIKSEASNESDSNNGSSDILDKEEIVKELKKVKNQNRLTHWLLSTMIVLTIAWQISEVSLILKIKQGFNHPFKSVGGILTWMLKGSGDTNNSKDEENHNNPFEFEAPSLPSLKIPELPHVELQDLTSSNQEEH